MVHIVHAIHRDDEKIGTVEEVDDFTAERYVSTGLARRASEQEIDAASGRPAPTATDGPTADGPVLAWPKPRLVQRAVQAGLDAAAAEALSKQELLDAIAHHEAHSAAKQ